MNITKETEMWFASHIKHKVACRTVFWFLKGRMNLIDTIWFTMLVTQEQMTENVSTNNPLFAILNEKEQAEKHLPPSKFS